MSVSLSLIAATAVLAIGRTSPSRAAFCTAAAATTAASSSAPISEYKIQLYQYKICPFCNRVKSYLDYLQIEYDTIEVNPLSKGEISKLEVKAKKVPIAVINGAVIEDSKTIIDFVSNSMVDSASNTRLNFNKQKFFPEDTEKWIEWSEKSLAVLLYPNITRSFNESWECFTYANDVVTWNVLTRMAVQYAGAAAMSMANGKIKKKYNIIDERKDLQECIATWTTALGSNTFLHGDYITLPDLVVFGVLKSIAGLSTFREIMTENEKLRVWYECVDKATPSCEGSSSFKLEKK